MIRVKDWENYDPLIINGWIKLYDELKEDDIPEKIISSPLELIVLK